MSAWREAGGSRGEAGGPRGGRSCFVVEAKSFEILVEEVGGKLKGCIWERCKGISSWIRFGEASLRCLLDGVETCCREPNNRGWAIGWEEGNRKYKLERRLNEAGRFILCSVRDSESKKFSLIFPEGKGQSLGWNLLAVRLRDLGVAPSGVFLAPKGPKDLTRERGGSKVQWREKGVELKSYADAVKISPRRVGQSVWLEVGEREVRERIDQLRQCLVGWWGLNSAPVPELEYVRRWASQQWALKGNLRVAMLGRGLLLFEFESSREAERVLARGARNIKENVIVLNRWNPEVGCLCKDSSAKEVWVRVVGLPLHLWSQEIFKRIGDGCGGFVAIDDYSLSSSEMQWARILVKCVEREFPSSVQIVVGSGCYSLQLWWELPPGFTQVVPAGSLSGEGGARGGEDDGGSQREKVEQWRV